MASDTSGLKAMADRLEKLSEALKGDWTDAGHAVGRAAKREATRTAQSVTGGSGRLRNMRGTRLSSGYELEEQGKRMTLALRPYGPWVIMEQGAKGHQIGPKRGRNRTVFGGAMFGGGTRAILAPGYDHPVTGPIGHPGMRQRRQAITKTFDRVREVGPRTYHEAMVKKIGEIYG